MRYHRCTSCGKHLCFTHAFRPFHKCLELDEDEAEEAGNQVYSDEFYARIKRIKQSNIPAVASSLRDNIPCVLDIPENLQDVMEGGVNALIPVVFEDGHRWLVRVKQQDNRPPLDGFNRMIAESEVETIKVLRERGLQVPGAYLPSSGDTDQSQLCYFFVEFVKGTPLELPLSDGEYPEEKQRKILYQLAKFNIELSQMSFPAVGSLYPPLDGSSGSHIGPITSNEMCEETSPYFLGPFQTNQERYLAVADFVLRKISEGVLCPDDPLPIYLWHLELKDIISGYDKWQDGGPYYLKHGDDKGDHIMADQDGNVTALIDWEWAYTTTKAEAFATPLVCYDLQMLLAEGRDELEPNEVVLIQAYEELGRPDLAECARLGRFYHLLGESLGHRPYIELVKGMRIVLKLPEYDLDTIEEWVEEMKKKYAGVSGVKPFVH
ncbi:hypothetical protein I316_06489 [Kwoniella heveanensis BCC8398]|uniref:Aminoglycoside phosphotransferase domain-containing protein n=1 Tax=Kwoniella heveanensis BCC8398 TaxID=1296120 RepID=A0A1B9GLD2_9TREE|nr:hypothetical protein I316_06489 [Kwoniella heveanensis BCC8398]